jgi:hypothetical protein
MIREVRDTRVWALRFLRWAYGVFIAAASLDAVRSSLAATGEGARSSHLVLLLAIPELIAALTFMFAPFEIAAGAVLLLVYLAAGVISAASGDLLAVLRFVYYAATAILIVVASRAQRPSAAPAA